MQQRFFMRTSYVQEQCRDRAEQSSTRSNNNSENTSVNISSSLPPCSLRCKKNNAYKELAGSWLGLLPRRSNLVRMNDRHGSADFLQLLLSAYSWNQFIARSKVTGGSLRAYLTSSRQVVRILSLNQYGNQYDNSRHNPILALEMKRNKETRQQTTHVFKLPTYD